MRRTLALVVLLGACSSGDVTAPPRVAGSLDETAPRTFRATYRLGNWAGLGLPVTVSTNQITPTRFHDVVLREGELQFSPDGRFRMVVVLRIDCVDVTGPCGSRAERGVYEGTYVLQYDDLCGEIPIGARLRTPRGQGFFAGNVPGGADCGSADFRHLELIPLEPGRAPILISGSEWFRVR